MGLEWTHVCTFLCHYLDKWTKMNIYNVSISEAGKDSQSSRCSLVLSLWPQRMFCGWKRVDFTRRSRYAKIRVLSQIQHPHVNHHLPVFLRPQDFLLRKSFLLNLGRVRGGVTIYIILKNAFLIKMMKFQGMRMEKRRIFDLLPNDWCWVTNNTSTNTLSSRAFFSEKVSFSIPWKHWILLRNWALCSVWVLKMNKLHTWEALTLKL